MPSKFSQITVIITFRGFECSACTRSIFPFGFCRKTIAVLFEIAPYVPAWIVARREEQPTQKNSGQIGEEISIDSGLDEPLAAQPEPLQRMEEQIEVPQEEPQEEIIPDEEGRNFEG